MRNQKGGLLGRWFGGSEGSVPPTDPGVTEENFGESPDGPVFAAGDTDIGRERDNNEDNLLCDPERGLFIVCDGMGGMAAGEQASAEAIRFLDAFLTSERIEAALLSGHEAVYTLFREALEGANRAIRTRVEERPEWEGMGSTVVLGLLADGALHLANLGDSRAYLIRKGGAEVLTQDHSVAAALAAHGELTPQQAREHPMRNHLTGFLGRETFKEPYHATRALCAEDRLVLCSDGLWDMVEDQDIARIAAQAASPSEAVHALIKAANRAGGADNITVIVIRVTGVELEPRAEDPEMVTASGTRRKESDAAQENRNVSE